MAEVYEFKYFFASESIGRSTQSCSSFFWRCTANSSELLLILMRI